MRTVQANDAFPGGRLMVQRGVFRALFTLRPSPRTARLHALEHTVGNAVTFAPDGLLAVNVRDAFSPGPTNNHVNALSPRRDRRGSHAGDIR